MRSREEGRTGRGAGFAKLLLALAAGLFLAWWIVKTSAVNAFLPRNPFGAATLAPDHPDVKLSLAMAEFSSRRGDIGEATRSRAFSALPQFPLAREPFLLAGVAALADGRNPEGTRLLEEARRRDPRYRPARLLMLDRYLRSNRIEDAAGEIAVLGRLISQASTVLIPELARLARDPETGTAVMRALRNDPEMQQTVLAHLAAGGAEPEVILRAARAAGAGPATPGASDWQRLLLAGLFAKGETRRAHSLWRGFTGLKGDAADKGLYDGDFRGLPGAAPFNWQLLANNAGVAERTATPALQVEYYGRERAELASQLLILRPGSYRIGLRVEGDAPGEGSRLTWTIGCATTAAPQLLEIPLTNVGSTPRTVAGIFTVPGSGCMAQWLKLIGAPDEFPSTQSVTVRGLRIQAVGSS